MIVIGSDNDHLEKHYVLIADLDLDTNLPDGRVFDDALIADTFKGVFDGARHTIDNLHIVGKEENDTGLFDNLRGIVKDLNLTDVLISGASCGSIAIMNHRGMILRCRVTGQVSGANDVGGLVGTFNR